MQPFQSLSDLLDLYKGLNAKTKCWGNVWREHTYAQRPSSAYILGTACLRVLAKPGMVWIRTLTASMGARAMSAKNSALAEAARYNDVLQR